jgi:hypothetical protein
MAEMAQLLEGSARQQRLAESGARLMLDVPESLAARIRLEIALWRALATAKGRRIEQAATVFIGRDGAAGLPSAPTGIASASRWTRDPECEAARRRPERSRTRARRRESPVAGGSRALVSLYGICRFGTGEERALRIRHFKGLAQAAGLSVLLAAASGPAQA